MYVSWSNRGLRAFAFAAFLALPAFSGAESPAPVPALPPSERFLYTRTVGDKVDEVEVRDRLVTDKGATWLEVTSRSAEQDILLRLDPATLFAVHVEVTSRGKDATLRRVTTVLENRLVPGPEDFVLSSFESLPYSLRAFPWGVRQKSKITFLGSGASVPGFGFDLTVTGKETIAVAGRDIECWKAQLSLAGLLGAFVGKSSLWYSVEYPHFLVKTDGSSGPGTPRSVLTLVGFSSGSKAE